jgi:hypothetical protein
MIRHLLNLHLAAEWTNFKDICLKKKGIRGIHMRLLDINAVFYAPSGNPILTARWQKHKRLAITAIIHK